MLCKKSIICKFDTIIYCMSHQETPEKKGFWDAFFRLADKVPSEIAGPIAIAALVFFLSIYILPLLKSDLHVALYLIILLMFGFGCTYAICKFAQSKANEREMKSLFKGIEISEKFSDRVQSEVQAAVSIMKEGEDEP